MSAKPTLTTVSTVATEKMVVPDQHHRDVVALLGVGHVDDLGEAPAQIRRLLLLHRAAARRCSAAPTSWTSAAPTRCWACRTG
jgi:hypothetical protein